MSVSIVIPVFNRAHLVRRAIDSALAQTVPCEVVLVDHGSTDDIHSVVESYGDSIRYVRKDIDRGPIACWRDGVESATGEYIHFTYDDDWIQPEFIERTLAYMDDDVAFVYSRVSLHEDRSSFESTRPFMIHPAGKREAVYIAKRLLISPLTISPGCALFRRQDVLKYLISEVPGASGCYGVGSGVGEDLLLFLLATIDYKYYAHVPEYLADFFVHDQSITIDADKSGRHQELVNAYAVAKQFYLKSPGSVAMPVGMYKILFKIKWNLMCRFRGVK